MKLAGTFSCVTLLLHGNPGQKVEWGTVRNDKSHLKSLDEIERDCIPGLVEVLQTEGIEGVDYALWNMTCWHELYDPCIWRQRATEEQKRVGWEMWMRMEKIICTLL